MSDIYAHLSDESIRDRLVNYMIKTPPLADRNKLVSLLAGAEGKQIDCGEDKC